MEYDSHQGMIDAKGLMQRLMLNNCRDMCANVQIDKGNTAKPSRLARIISRENPVKIYVAFTNCKTIGEYKAKFQSY